MTHCEFDICPCHCEFSEKVPAMGPNEKDIVVCPNPTHWKGQVTYCPHCPSLLAMSSIGARLELTGPR